MAAKGARKFCDYCSKEVQPKPVPGNGSHHLRIVHGLWACPTCFEEVA